MRTAFSLAFFSVVYAFLYISMALKKKPLLNASSASSACLLCAIAPAAQTRTNARRRIGLASSVAIADGATFQGEINTAAATVTAYTRKAPNAGGATVRSFIALIGFVTTKK